MSDVRLQVVEAPGAYIFFVVSAFVLTLVGGPLLGTLLWMSRSGTALTGRSAAMVQAHGWLQLVGWAGLFVAGFSLRLAPRFSGRPERPAGEAITILGLLVAGSLVRTIGLVAGGPLALLVLVGSALAAAGMLGVALSAAMTLRRNRQPGAPWALLAWCGAGWWAIAAALLLAGGWLAAAGSVVPAALDRGSAWAFILGAVGNFIWAVQGRMMPTSFGRAPVGRGTVIALAGLYNLGLAAVVAGALARYSSALAGVAGWVSATGFGAAGISVACLAATCGVLAGQARRLRPASQHLGPYIVWANRWALLGGMLLVLYSVRAVIPPPLARVGLEDGALHALGTGLVTILIAGMLQLVAPVFAVQRMAARGGDRLSSAVLLLLMAAAATRVSGALLPGAFNILAGISGLTGWLALAALAGAIAVARSRTVTVPQPPRRQID